jgi:coenzyme F420-reducing hydrogenase beta subunit
MLFWAASMIIPGAKSVMAALCANELADVASCGEVYEFGFHKEGAKRSHTVVRTKMGGSLFTAAVEDGYLEATKVSEEDVARNLDFVIKKVGNIPRIEERKKLGLPLPKFGNYPFM